MEIHEKNITLAWKAFLLFDLQIIQFRPPYKVRIVRRFLTLWVFPCFFFFFFFPNNFRFTSYKYVTFGYPKVHRPTYLIVISIDDLAPNRPQIHDDVIEWKHFPRYWPFVRGIHRSPVNSPVPVKFPTQRPVTRSFGVFFDLPLNNGWVNNREAGDLRRYGAHYDVSVMFEYGMVP